MKKLLLLLCVTAISGLCSAANVFFLGNGDSSDAVLVSVLRSLGHTVVVGPTSEAFVGSNIPTTTNVFFVRQLYYYPMPAGGQGAILNAINKGAGLLVSGEVTNYQYSNGYSTLSPALPFSSNTRSNQFYGYALNRAAADSVLGRSLQSTIGISSAYYDGAMTYVPKPGANVYYTSILNSATQNTVVGWYYNKGRVLALPFNNYASDLNTATAEARTFLGNCATWAAGAARTSWIAMQDVTNGTVSTLKVVNHAISGGAVVVSTASNTTTRLVGSGDYNGDGITDLCLRSTSTGALTSWYINPPKLYVSTKPTRSRTLTNSLIGFGDFNGDGYPDTLYFNPLQNQFEVDPQFSFTTLATQTVNGSPIPGYTAVGVGDFNADGNPDILWRNNANGSLGYWKMTRYNVDGFVSITTAVPAGTVVGGVGDLNGDGRADIVLYNPSSRAMTLWLLNANGTTAASYGLGVSPPNLEPRCLGYW